MHTHIEGMSALCATVLVAELINSNIAQLLGGCMIIN
jgi:hypothetical protein